MTPAIEMDDYSTGLELILNACEGVLQIGVTENEKPLCFEEWHQTRRATEILVPALEQICARLAISPANFRRIGCFAGPGSFTGIRLVLATAAAMRRASRAQLASLDYLQALATSAVQRRGLLYGGIVYVITHARRDLVHFQKFISFGPVIPAQPAAPVELLPPGETLKRINQEPCLICGSALIRHAEIFAQAADGTGTAATSQTILLPDVVHPVFSALCLLARHGDYFPQDVEPKYVRGCDAVENLIEKKGENSPELRQLEQILKKDNP